MTSMKKWLGAAALGALLVLGSGNIVEAAKEQLIVNLVNEPSSLDPHVQWNPDSYSVYRNIFDNLVTRDDAGKIIPQVATSWRNISDSEIEFTLREDIKFHDGKALTVDDVVYSVQRITDPKFASPQLSQFNKIIKAEAVGANKVKLTTDGAYPALLAQLVKLSIVPKHVAEAVGKEAFNLKPVGSGPYAFDSWRRGVEVVLTRNDAYWGTKGPFAKAVFRAVPDGATRLANLQAGAADLVVTLDSDQAAQIKSSPRAKPLVVLTERVAYFNMNNQRPPFSDVRMRQAIAYAIDKKAIAEGILGGYDKPVDQFMSPAHVGWVDGITGISYDPGKAKALIAQVGPTAKNKLAIATSPVFDQRIVQAIQHMLQEVGLNVEIETQDMASWLQRVQSGPEKSPDMNFSRWSCACQDADGIIFPLLHSSSGWASLRNKEIDAELDAARSTLDEKKRLEHYKKVHEFVSKEVPLVPLYQAAIIYGGAKQLEWTPTPNESMFLNRMSWKD
jgi:peptide/nickel transport system substrate-binding protein